MTYVVAVWREHALHRELRPENASGKKTVGTKKEVANLVRRMKRMAVPGTMFTWPEVAVFADGKVIEHWRLGRGLKYVLVEDEGLSGDVESEDDEDEFEIDESIVEDAIQFFADDSAAQGWSFNEDNEKIVVAQFGDAVAVNGDTLIDGFWEKELKLPASKHPKLWSDVGLQKFDAWLRKHDWEETNDGGDVPTDEQEISVEHVARYIARENGLDEGKVEEYLEKKHSRGRNELYWSASGYTTVYRQAEERPRLRR